MGYTNSTRAIKRVEAYLEQMLQATTALVWEFPDVHKAHWAIRNGMKAAANTQDPAYLKYRSLGSKYILRQKNNSLIAELRDAPLQMQMATMIFDDLIDALGIIGAAIEHKSPRLSFPNAVLSDEDLISLYNYTSSVGYNIIVAEKGVTITKEDVAFAWKPEAA